MRLHTEAIRPPRALFVPFALGRPLGAPGDPAFQTRVLRAALALLEADAGPVLVDFAEDAPPAGEDDAAWSCPVPLSPRPRDPRDLGGAFERELARMLPWYAAAVERRGRTTVGLAGLEPPDVGAFLVRMLEPPLPESPTAGTPLGMALKHAAEDLKAIYLEAARLRPGPEPRDARVSSDALQAWFWEETRAGDLLRALRDGLVRADDPGVALVARLMLVPESRT